MPTPFPNHVAAMSLPTRLEVVLRKAATLLPKEVGNRLLALLTPTAIALMAGVVVIWAGSHFFGVGEIADIILLTVGWIAIGGGALAGGKKLLAFAISTKNARNTADLDRAARELADAITILGVDVVLGLLLRGKPKGTFKEPFNPGTVMPSYRQLAPVMPKSGPMRMYEARLIFTRKSEASLGRTRVGDNVATVGRRFEPGFKKAKDAAREVRRTVYHERVHQRLTQAFSLLGKPAVYMRMGAYKRSYILRYIEEAAAETYGLARSGGIYSAELTGMQFPLYGPYGITITKMGQEAKGILLGPVVVGGSIFQSYFGMIDGN